MRTYDYTTLLSDLHDEHRGRSPRSAAIHDDARRYLVDGGSHGRFVAPMLLYARLSYATV